MRESHCNKALEENSKNSAFENEATPKMFAHKSRTRHKEHFHKVWHYMYQQNERFLYWELFMFSIIEQIRKKKKFSYSIH